MFNKDTLLVKQMLQTIERTKIYAFRNIIAHDYFGIDEEEVYGIIKKHIPKLQTDLQNLIN